MNLSETSQAFDLLKNMLQLDPSQRLTCTQALRHKYVGESMTNCLVDDQNRPLVYSETPLKPIESTTTTTSSRRRSRSSSSGGSLKKKKRRVVE